MIPRPCQPETCARARVVEHLQGIDLEPGRPMKTLADLVTVVLAFLAAVVYALVWSGQKP
jgi:hypothetical protein